MRDTLVGWVLFSAVPVYCRGCNKQLMVAAGLHFHTEAVNKGVFVAGLAYVTQS